MDASVFVDVALPQQGAVEVPSRDQLLGVDVVPLLELAPSVSDEVGQRVVGGQPVSLVGGWPGCDGPSRRRAGGRSGRRGRGRR